MTVARAIAAIDADGSTRTTARDDGRLGHTLFVASLSDFRFADRNIAVATLYPSGRFSVGGECGERVRARLVSAGFEPMRPIR